MNFFDLLVGLRGGGGYGSAIRYGIAEGTDAEVEPDSLTVLYTCVKILADNFSRVPARVKNGNEKIVPHLASDLWNNRPNGWQNPQVMRSTSEWERNLYGNSFFDITSHGLEYIAANEVADFKRGNGKLEYMLMPLADPRITDSRAAGYIDSRKVLHFRGVSNNGVFGMSPLGAAHSTHQLMTNAIRTVNNFYKNDAMAKHAIERTVPTGANYQNVLADRQLFEREYAGVENAGKAIHLSLGEKITPLAVKFADQELIKTMEFSRDTITSLYQVPNWMLSANDSTQDVEQQTAQFVSGTLANIANVYASEIAFKLLKPDEVRKGFKVEFDLDVIKEVTFGDKVTALKEAVNNTLMTPDQANRRLGFEGIEGKYGKYHFAQAQMIPLEEYERYNPLIKDTANVNKALNDKRLK